MLYKGLNKQNDTNLKLKWNKNNLCMVYLTIKMKPDFGFLINNDNCIVRTGFLRELGV